MGESFEDRLNAPDPPERIHAAEVDLFGETRTIRSSDSGLPNYGVMRFNWHRPDGRTLSYGRWTDDDGEWFYPLDEVVRRAAFTPSGDA